MNASVYQRALIEELGLCGFRVKPQAIYPVACKGKHIDTYGADLVVEERLLVEAKMRQQFFNLARCINYLKVSRLHMALLIDFRHPKVEWRRVVHRL